jgi:DNA polymerase-3 subunit delta
MVYDAVHNVVGTALGDLDPSVALEDFTAKDVTSSSEPVTARVLEALNTPPFLVPRRVVVVRDAHSLVADEVALLLDWMHNPAPSVVLVLAIVGNKAHKLVKGADEVVEVNVGSRSAERVSFVESKLSEYRVTIDHGTAQKVADQVGDDVARVDALARTLQSIYGSAPLNFSHIEPYLGDAGDVPEWDLTDAIDSGNAATAIVVARRMLDSKRMAKLEGSGVRGADDAAALLGIRTFPATKSLQMSQRLGTERISTAVHWITNADIALKGGVSYGGKDLNTDMDVTELTVIEILVARLAKMTQGARRR